MTRVYESNGPDVKIRGTAVHVAEKYLQLARDAQTSGDPVVGRKLLSARRALFPPDRRRAGAIPAEQSATSSRTGQRHRASESTTIEGDDEIGDAADEQCRQTQPFGTARAATVPAARGAALLRRTQPHVPRPQQQQQPRPRQRRPARPAAGDAAAACRPAAVVHHRRPATAGRSSAAAAAGQQSAGPQRSERPRRSAATASRCIAGAAAIAARANSPDMAGAGSRAAAADSGDSCRRGE